MFNYLRNNSENLDLIPTRQVNSLSRPISIIRPSQRFKEATNQVNNESEIITIKDNENSPLCKNCAGEFPNIIALVFKLNFFL